MVMNRQRSGPRAAWCPPGTCRLALCPPFQQRTAAQQGHGSAATPRRRAGRAEASGTSAPPSLHPPHQARDVAQDAQEDHLRVALNRLVTHEDLQREGRGCLLPGPDLFQVGLGVGEEDTRT